MSLEEAILSGNVKQVESLIAQRSVDVSAPLPRRNRPILLAADRNQPAIAAALLKAGARVDDTDDNGRTACHIAAGRNFHELLAVLLAHRPKLSAHCKEKQTPLDAAIHASHERCIVLLVAAGAPLQAKRQQLWKVAAMSAAVVHALHNRGVSISRLRNESKRTPLHLAAWSRLFKPDLMELLVGCGVRLEARDVLGETAAHVAARNRHEEHLAWLLQAGADCESPNNHGRTVLHTACKFGNIASVFTLLAAGADVDALNEDGDSACHFAVHRLINDAFSGMAMVRALLAAGGDLDAPNRRGITARQLHPDCLRKLLDEAEILETARSRIAKMRLDLVRKRAFEVCVGLQSLRLDALQLCEILQQACGRAAPLIAFHQWWAIATTVKHFRRKN